MKNQAIPNGCSLGMKQRNDRISRTHLNHVRESTKDRCCIKGNRLSVNNKAYTVDDFLNEKNTRTKHNSAPPTPNNYPNRLLVLEEDTQQHTTGKHRTGAEEKQTKSGIREEGKILTDLGELNTSKKKAIRKQINKPQCHSPKKQQGID
ncbi:hypothetical protein JTB14_025011 [Gonioctena quinquepunctata]|nr:hypothetical protein JTB14_025011 [Gonioctena quinquepunctata]